MFFFYCFNQNHSLIHIFKYFRNKLKVKTFTHDFLKHDKIKKLYLKQIYTNFCLKYDYPYFIMDFTSTNFCELFFKKPNNIKIPLYRK